MKNFIFTLIVMCCMVLMSACTNKAVVEEISPVTDKVIVNS